MRCIKIASAALLLLCFTGNAKAQSIDAKYLETYTQYLPMAADLGMGFIPGVKAENCFVDRAIACGVANLSELLIVNVLLKNVVKEDRPDGTSPNSFPSGHTVTAFIGAELVRHEYGWGWGLGAYAVAASVGVLRVEHNRHWPIDVMAGACIGILCANIGYWTLPGIKSVLGIKTSSGANMTFYPSIDSRSGALCAGFAMTF